MSWLNPTKKSFGCIGLGKGYNALAGLNVEG